MACPKQQQRKAISSSVRRVVDGSAPYCGSNGALGLWTVCLGKRLVLQTSQSGLRAPNARGRWVVSVEMKRRRTGRTIGTGVKSERACPTITAVALPVYLHCTRGLCVRSTCNCCFCGPKQGGFFLFQSRRSFNERLKLMQVRQRVRRKISCQAQDSAPDRGEKLAAANKLATAVRLAAVALAQCRSTWSGEDERVSLLFIADHC